MNMHNPPHPGEVLREWLEGVTATDAAARLGVTRVAFSRILNGAAGLSAEMDLRLSKALNTTPGMWYAPRCAQYWTACRPDTGATP